jgi:hypothetical protein
MSLMSSAHHGDPIKETQIVFQNPPVKGYEHVETLPYSIISGKTKIAIVSLQGGGRVKFSSCLYIKTTRIGVIHLQSGN